MSAALLFQWTSTTPNTDLATGDCLFTAPGGGLTMVTGIWLAAPEQGNSNDLRMYHCKQTETPGPENMLLRFNVGFRDDLPQYFHNVKIIMEPGDKLYGALHAGDAVTVSAYGLVPSESSF